MRLPSFTSLTCLLMLILFSSSSELDKFGIIGTLLPLVNMLWYLLLQFLHHLTWPDKSMHGATTTRITDFRADPIWQAPEVKMNVDGARDDTICNAETGICWRVMCCWLKLNFVLLWHLVGKLRFGQCGELCTWHNFYS